MVTGHRIENHGQGFDNIRIALRQIANENLDTQIVYPVHLNPKVQKTVLVMKETTERQEAVNAGAVLLVDTETKKTVEKTSALLNYKGFYSTMSRPHNPYGDGNSCEKIVCFIKSLET